MAPREVAPPPVTAGRCVSQVVVEERVRSHGIGVVVFAVWPAARDGAWTTALLFGALFGFMAYATDDLSNLATLRGYTAPNAADQPAGTASASDQTGGAAAPFATTRSPGAMRAPPMRAVSDVVRETPMPDVNLSGGMLSASKA